MLTTSLLYSLAISVRGAYLNPSLVLLQTLCFLLDLTCLFVLAMTQDGTEAFCFLAFIRRFFLDASLFLPMPSKSS